MVGKSSTRDRALLVLIWLLATACNMNKAYHIDDTAHLEIAAWIAEHPGAPMSGLVNWGDSAEPIHRLNQPSLYYYMLAGWGRLFGYGEVAMHALQSLFTLAATFLFFGIARILVPAYALILTSLLILGPAFLVGQNLMVDVPVLACSLAFFYLLFKPRVRSEHGRYALAGLLASSAVLMKYSCLPLLPVLLIHIVARRQFRVLYAALIPIAVLAVWSWFNYFEYGSVHILDRPSRPIVPGRVSEMTFRWVIALGSIAPFSVLILADTWSHITKWRLSRRVITGAIVFLFTGGATLYFRGHVIGPHALLAALFLMNGTYLIVMAGIAFVRHERGHASLPYLWFAATFAFIVLFAPFLATRHVLLSLPALLLILGSVLPSAPPPRAGLVAIGVTVMLTSGLAIADREFAGYYRKQALVIRSSLPIESTVWFTGHWGWQWYAKKSGMRQIDRRRSKPVPGDYVVKPLAINRQDTHPELKLELLDVIKETPVAFPRFSTASGAAGFYSARHLPWTISRDTFGAIEIYRVVSGQ